MEELVDQVIIFPLLQLLGCKISPQVQGNIGWALMQVKQALYVLSDDGAGRGPEDREGNSTSSRDLSSSQDESLPAVEAGG